MPRAINKLVRNGSSVVITIPKPIMVNVGWLAGESIIVEQLEDGSVLLRRPCSNDFLPLRAPRLVYDEPAVISK